MLPYSKIESGSAASRMFQNNALDGMRGFAALQVFMSHTSNAGIFLAPFLDFSGLGKSGVYLFFVLSSFLLTLPFIKEGSSALTGSFLANYFFRRFARIYPLYFLYVLAGFVTSLACWYLIAPRILWNVPFPVSPGIFLDQMILTKGFGVTWSILVEFHYYFCLPVLGLVFSIALKNRVVPCLILTIALIGLAEVFWPENASTVNDPRLGPYLPIFFMGAFLAVIYHHWCRSNRGGDPHIQRLIAVAGLLSFGVLIALIPSVASRLVGKTLPFDYNHKQFLIFGFLWSIVVFSCLTSSSLLRRFFETRVLRYFGLISFSVYLSHVVFLQLALEIEQALGKQIPFVGWLILATTVVVSHLSWMAIERPMSRLRMNVAWKRERVADGV